MPRLLGNSCWRAGARIKDRKGKEEGTSDGVGRVRFQCADRH